MAEREQGHAAYEEPAYVRDLKASRAMKRLYGQLHNIQRGFNLPFIEIGEQYRSGKEYKNQTPEERERDLFASEVMHAYKSAIIPATLDILRLPDIEKRHVEAGQESEFPDEQVVAQVQRRYQRQRRELEANAARFPQFANDKKTKPHYQKFYAVLDKMIAQCETFLDREGQETTL